jgi:pSer/pThr/pTyr-binding forkhead associated (FHA) protein
MEPLLYTAVAVVLGWLGWRKRFDIAGFVKTISENLTGSSATGPSSDNTGSATPRSEPESDDESGETMVVTRGTFGSITCVSGALLGQRFAIPGHGLSIGRDPESDVVVDDSRVSAKHARVLPKQGAVVVVDVESLNGVFLNDFQHRVAGEASLQPGDIFMLSATDAAHFIYRK